MPALPAPAAYWRKCRNCGWFVNYMDNHTCTRPPATDDPLAHREVKAHEDARLLAMLRVTLTERIAHAEERLANVGGDVAIGLWAGRASAYEDVLSLLGPEDPTDTSKEPF